MSKEIQTVKSLLSQDNVKAKFQEILKERAAGFTANLAVVGQVSVGPWSAARRGRHLLGTNT